MYSIGLKKLSEIICAVALIAFSSSASAQGAKTVKNPSEPTPEEKPDIAQTGNSAAAQPGNDQTARDPESADWKQIVQKEREDFDGDTDADQPAAREEYFRRGRTVMGESAAALLRRGFLQKQAMIEQIKEVKGLIARGIAGNIAAPHLMAAAAFSNLNWISMGPAPIVSDPTNRQSYGYVTGRVTAIAVDQSDLSGNTVYVGGAYGGVWKSQNAAAADATTVAWTQLLDAQVTEAIGAISVQPGGTGVVLVGTGEPNGSGDSYYGQGVLRSVDNGTTWINITSADNGVHPFIGGGFSKFAWSTTSTNFVVAAFANVGIANGTTPNVCANPNPNACIGLYYSTNAGVTWTSANVTDAGTTIQPGSVRDVIYNSFFNKFFAFIRFHGIYFSPDGINWLRLPDANQPGSAMTLLNCPSNPSNGSTCPAARGALSYRRDTGAMYVVYVNGNLSDDSSGTVGSTAGNSGIYVATVDPSNGGTWTQLGESGFVACSDGSGSGCGYVQSFYNMYIQVLPDTADSTKTDIYLGFVNLFKCIATSTDPYCKNTNDWFNLTHVYGCNPTGSLSFVHPDQHAMDFSTTNPSIMYFGDDGGVNRTLNGPGLSAANSVCGQHNPFDNLNQNIGSMSELVDFSQDPTNSGIVLAGLQDNGSPLLNPNITTPNNTVWQGANLGDGGFNAIDPNNPNVYYTSNTKVSIQHCNLGLNCNVNNFSYLVTNLGGDVAPFYMPFILDPQNTSQILAGTCRLWRVAVSGAATGSPTVVSTPLSLNLSTLSATICSGSNPDIQAIGAGGSVTPNGSQVIYV